jgi:lipopolysaccharide biosynthesis glycosyltransferase
MKYLYVLTSDNSDYYLEQALLSITSLRLQMPKAFISLLVDDTTESGLTGKRSGICGMVNEFISVKIDEQFNKKARSRWLKTSMRQHITGDFLYIDCDTVIADDLSSLDSVDASLGAILDDHYCLADWKKYKPAYLDGMQLIDIKLGFASTIKLNTYFNGGIFLCNDCITGHDFFREWHRLWLYCFEKGTLTDQQSLNQTNYTMGEVITELDGKWNCQILADGAIKYLHDAKIIHCYTTQPGEKPYLPASQSVLEKIKETGNVNQELKDMLKNPRSLFTPDARLILTSNVFHSSAIYAFSKRIYLSKFGRKKKKIFVLIRMKIYRPLKKILFS